MKHTYTIYLFLLLAIAAISAEGCSLIGYAIGSRIDDDHKVSHDTTAAFTQPLFGDIGDNTGMFARIQYNDSTVRYASFEGYTDEPDSAYRARWNSFLRMHPNSPEPFKFGDSIIAGKGNDDHKYVGQFTGYSLDGIDLSFLHTGSVL